MIVVPDASAIGLLGDLVDSIDTWYHLVVQPVVLTQATTLVDLVEATWPDYVPQRVTTWTPPLTVGGRARTRADPVLWRRGVGGVASLVYAYYVTDTRTGPLLWVELRPGGPLTMTRPTDELLVLPQLTLRADPLA